MITKSQSEKLKELIGAAPAVKIAEYLEENEIFNRSGNPFSDSMITRVLNGRTKHPELMAAILDFAEIKKKEAEKTRKRIEELVEDE